MAFFRGKVRDIFGCDLRSLAFFRIGLATLILLDLIDRSRDLRAHYTDWGLMPRAALIDLFLHPSCLSLHFINGTWEWAAFLFLVAGLFAVGLLVGYRTRLMTVVSWILLVSLQNRNPLVLQGGDILFRVVAFWAMFLPLGARASMDRYLEKQQGIAEPGETVVLSWATAAVLIQVCLLYVYAGVLKTGVEWTRDYTAVYYALHVDQLTTPLGHWLLDYPRVMKAMTYLTIKIEIFGPLLFFMPVFTGFFRLLAIVLLAGLQMGFGSTMRIYIFPWTCICATVPMIPSVFWDKLPAKIRALSAYGPRLAEWLKTRFFFDKLLRHLPPKPVSTRLSTWANVTAGLFLLYVFVWNLGTLPASMNKKRIDVPRKLKWIASVLRLDQTWNMFAPYPLKDDGWYVIPGVLKNNQEVDVFRGGGPVSWEKPKYVAYMYKNQRWQKYMMNLWSKDFSEFRLYYGRYLCRVWNDHHKGGEQLDHFSINYMRQDTRLNGEAAPQKVDLWDHYCFKVPETAPLSETKPAKPSAPVK
ncbi:MAG TPA: HTTM domain-containing protein [bacterium]|nr:HTTM domain-containing protein [bacterium]